MTISAGPYKMCVKDISCTMRVAKKLIYKTVSKKSEMGKNIKNIYEEALGY